MHLSKYVEELFDDLSLSPKEYIEILSSMKRAFRINTLKISKEQFLEFTDIEFSPSPLENAFLVPKEYSIGNTVEFSLGYIHTQSLSSMLPPLLLNPSKHSFVLDSTASPGGKTTQLAEIMRNTGLIVANDKNVKRLSPLVSNLSRLGVLNTIVTSYDARYLPFKNSFDFILLDAPCSNLGSSLRALERTTKNRVRDLARIQRKLILSSFDALKPEGELVYSTCTITIKENEEVISYLLANRENAKLEKINLPNNIRYSKAISDEKEIKKAIRIYPEHLESEAFFIAKIRKNK